VFYRPFKNLSCIPYNATGICKGSLSVYACQVKYAIDTSNGADISNVLMIEQQFGVLLSYSSFIIHKRCLDVLLPFICRWALFPTCDPAFDLSIKQNVCRRACEILTMFMCPEAWRAYIQQFPILNVPKGNSLSCKNLKDANAGDIPDCIDPLNGGDYMYMYIYIYIYVV